MLGALASHLPQLGRTATSSARGPAHDYIAVNAFCFIGSVESPRIFEVKVSRFASSVRKQHADRHVCALRIVRRVEVRQVLLHGIIERNLALFVELDHRRRRGKGLRQRRDVEDRVLGRSAGGERNATPLITGSGAVGSRCRSGRRSGSSLMATVVSIRASGMPECQMPANTGKVEPHT
jgi:hypothetical protein